MRRSQAPKRPVLPDPKFQSRTVTKFTNKLMRNGKKSTAERMRFAPEQGMEVVATGKMTTFPGKSQYQLVIDSDSAVSKEVNRLVSDGLRLSQPEADRIRSEFGIAQNAATVDHVDETALAAAKLLLQPGRGQAVSRR